MSIRRHLPIALTIAGSDSGGGAGLQADLKTFAALGVHGTSVITCLTAQNPRRVLGVEACSPEILQRQMEAIFSELPPAAIKTGMLYSAQNIRIVATFLKNTAGGIPLVVDPVMVSTSGTRLLAPDAMVQLQRRLLPLAALITPNLDEAAILVEGKITTLEMMCAAARTIHARHGCAVLLKGGHLKDSTEAIDVFFDGHTELRLAAPFVRKIATHGTGCTYSAAICAALAQGKSLPQAARLAKNFITRAIAGSRRIGDYFVLGQPPDGQRLGRRKRK